MTIIVSELVQVSARNFRRATTALLALALSLAASGCSYIFSEKRTVYRYEPTYPVESAEFLRSLDALGTEMMDGNRVVLLENGDGIFPSMLEAIAGARRTATGTPHPRSRRCTAAAGTRARAPPSGGRPPSGRGGLGSADSSCRRRSLQ